MEDRRLNFRKLFNKYKVPKHLEHIVDNCHIDSVNASRNNRAIDMTLHFEDIMDPLLLDELKAGIASTYNLNSLTVNVKYPPSLFGSGCDLTIIRHVKNSMPVANGFLNSCIMTYTESSLKITLTNGGYKLLTAQKCDAVIKKLIHEMFGLNVNVEFDGTLEIDPLSDEYKDITQSAMKSFEVASNIKKPSAGGQNTNKPKTDLIFGRPIKGETVPIGSINQDSGRVIIKGDIFSLERKDVKAGAMTVLSIEMTDYTGSIKVSRLFKKEEIAFADELKVGMNVLVRGDAEFNRFEKDTIIRPLDICACQKQEIDDCSADKRVELHLHTNMSAMDGIFDIEDYVIQAKKWGHTAIAVTDHGVAQAYPGAMLAGAKHGVKIIYGIEDYFVNDTNPAAFGTQDMPLNGEFIIFDLETTGLNPTQEGITQIGAIKISNFEVVDTFDTFVNPRMPIPTKITELTGITDEMVKDAPDCESALKSFYEFCSGLPLVAHNASFDVGFLKIHSQKASIAFKYTYIDTLAICRFLFPELKKHRLNIIAEHLKLPPFEHHRACDDAHVLADIFVILCKKLQQEHSVESVAGINEALAGGADYKSYNTTHQVILVKNYVGLKNLYKLISFSHLNYFYKRPRMLKSVIEQYREGLIIGSACDAGELYVAIREGRPWDELIKIAEYYDYLEIQPIGNSMHLIESQKVENIEKLKEIGRTICRLGEKLSKPVVATGDVHFLKPRDEIFRAILMSGQGYADADSQAPLYFRTTDDMLKEFSYLGEEKAFEVVVTNTNKIADMCENIRPVPKGAFPPKIDNAPQELKFLSEKRAKEIYGDPLPEIVKIRMDRELDSIITHGFSVMYIIAQKLVSKSMEDGYLVGSRGSVGSSVIAFLSGITEVNALPPHYVCPKCKYSEFITDGNYGTGIDMPEKDCKNCNSRMKKDGYDIPFETFLGFDGDKEPDIDLNFSGEYQARAHKYTETLFGTGYVFRAGTIGTIADKTAYGFVKKYLEEKNKVVSKAEENRLTVGCSGVKRTTGQHPGGVMIVPKDKEIYDFCPVQHPADDTSSDIITTHFDYHSIHDNLLKLDLLGHDDPTAIKMLEDLTGVDARSIPLDDEDTMRIFTSNEPLMIEPDDIISKVGTIAVPEFGTRFVRQMLEETMPTTFIELVNIAGLSHGTDVWINNAQDIVTSHTAKLSEVICTRDDIMIDLLRKGLPKKEAFSIMENVRKGKGLKPEWVELMHSHDVQKWYVDSCNKIKYMFPKAHAVAYVMMSFRIAYFKVHYPQAFYTTYFTVRADAFDAEYMINGIDVVRSKIKQIEQNPNATNKEKDMVTVLEVCYEMYKRGLQFCPIDLYKSDPVRFQICGEKILPSLMALQGMGGSAAYNIADARTEGEFSSHDDLRIRAKISKTLIETLSKSGVLNGIPQSSQTSLF